jgi:hypothetical protein
VIAEEVEQQYQVHPAGRTDQVRERFRALSMGAR